MEAQLAWDISDTFNGLMMFPNLIGVLVLSPQVIRCTHNYVERRLLGKKVVQKLCEEKRIPGISKIGYMWLIPRDAEKLTDKRCKKSKSTQ